MDTPQPWSSGAANYLTDVEHDRKIFIGVRCRLGNLEESDLALLDTGAEWSVIGGSTAELLVDTLSDPTERISIITRLGKFGGTLHRLTFFLLAQPGWGADLEISGTVLVCPEWPGPVVLGYHGFLERVRIGIDPGSTNTDEQIIFFGESA